MEIENCQIRGQVSLDPRYWMENHRMVPGPRGDCPAHISRDSDSELPTKVALWKHSVGTHFPKKTDIAKYACEPR